MRATLLVLVVLLAGCTQTAPPDATTTIPTGRLGESPPGACAAPIPDEPEPPRGSGAVTLVVAPGVSFPDGLAEDFANESGWTLVVERADSLDDAFARAQHADVLYGLDESMVLRSQARMALAPHNSLALGLVSDRVRLPFCDDGDMLATPIEFEYVSLNVDASWLARDGVPLPLDLAVISNPTYAPRTTLDDPETSARGYAFLLTTVARFGDEYATFWSDYAKNGGRVAAEGSRDSAIVLGSTTLPAHRKSSNTTALDLPNATWLHVTAAGLLHNAPSPEGARAFLNHAQRSSWQAHIASSHGTFPAVATAPMPPEYAQVQRPTHVATIPASVLAAEADGWLEGWRAAFRGAS